MTGAAGSVAALAEHLVRVEVGHVVSSSSMVSRAYLIDNCVGVVVEAAANAAGERGLFLVSSLLALAPDPDGLRVRAAEEGGIPVEYGIPRLVKITLGWDESSVELKGPVVVPGSGVGVVSLAVPASLGDKIRSGAGPSPVVLDVDLTLSLGDELAVVVRSGGEPVVRWARVSSDSGFGGVEAGLALDIGVPAVMAGAPVFRLDRDGSRFCGLAGAVDATTSLLVSTSAIAATIQAAG